MRKDHFASAFSKFKDFQIICIDMSCFNYMTCRKAKFLNESGKRRRQAFIQKKTQHFRKPFARGYNVH